MKLAIALCGAALLSPLATAFGGELKSGLQSGDDVDPFVVEKVAGAVNDNIPVGSILCYRCVLGSRPVVMVFARKADKDLVALVKQLDQAVVDRADQKLSALVNLIGKNPEELKKAGAELAKTNDIENVAFVVPQDNENGPAEFHISPDAETTVMLYRRGKVAANYAVPPGKLDDATMQAIVYSIGKILP
jgi:hypothetical protein